MKRILYVVGARPNFMKIAPIMREIARYQNTIEQMLVHTGQHYDRNMSQVFFEELDLPLPDVNLEVGSASHAQQTALIMQRFEPVLLDYQPDWVLVPGDVNSTVACALVASKLNIKVAHVEAGLRAFDRSMPEEINRILTDHLADLLFTTEPSGNENLLREGIAEEKISFVGNTMIDTLVHLLPSAEVRWSTWKKRIPAERYILVTLHRPSNVDDPMVLKEILTALEHISQQIPVVFPVHPRTRQRITTMNPNLINAIWLLEPQGYLDFLALQTHAALVLTDSGGVQEETTYLGIPCLTARPNTERPVTITHGTNHLVASQTQEILSEVNKALEHPTSKKPPVLMWDGLASQRIFQALIETL